MIYLGHLNATVWLVTFCGSFTSISSPTKEETKLKKSKKLRVQTIFRRFFYILYLFSPLRQTHLSDCPGKIIKQSSSKFFFANVSSA